MKHYYAIPRILNSEYYALFHGKGKLMSVMLYLLEDCQCSCKHCYNENYYLNPKGASRKKLNIETVKKVISDARKIGAINVNFAGGEPLLYDDLFEALEYSVQHGMVTNILTNGENLNRNKIRLLKKTGIQTLFVSLDYLDERHNKFRGRKGLVSKVLNNIKICKEEKLNCIINYVLTSKRILDGSFEEMVNYCKNNRFFLNINFPYKIGKWEKNTDETLTLKEEKWAKTKYPNILKFHNDRYLTGKCCAGSEKIVVTSSGDVIPCELIRLKLGNIYEDNFIDIYNKSYHNKMLDKLRKSKFPCRKSKYNNIFKKYTKIKMG